MRKHTYLRLVTLLLIFTTLTNLYANEEFSDFIRLGHSNEDYKRYDNLDNPNQDANLKRAAAIYIPASKMKLYKGNRITAIKFAIARITFFTEWKVFIAKDLNKPYEYTQNIQSASDLLTGWNSIELSVPYEINSDDGIYIGYEYRTSTNMVGRLTDNTDTSMDWIYREGKWIPGSDAHANALAIQGVVKGDRLPKYNINLQRSVVPIFSKTNEPVIISGILENEGTATITDFKVNYRINGGEWIPYTIGNVNIPYESSYSFETNNLILTKEGEYEIEVSVSDLNGQTDIDPSDNVSQPYTIGCAEKLTQRNILMEIYSTERCPNCPDGHKHIDKIVNGNEHVIMVGHHSGYGRDQYTHDASLEYAAFWDIRNAPTVMVDRMNLNRYNANLSADNPKFGAGSLTTELLDDALTFPAFVSVNLSHQYDKENRKVTVHVDGKRLLPLSGTDYRLTVYLIENNIHTVTQAGSNGGFYHQHTLRQVLTEGSWGKNINPDNYSEDFETTLDEEWNCDEIHIVAFVSNYDADDINNCIVYNTSQIKLTPGGSAIEKEEISNITVHTADKTVFIEGVYDGFRLFNATGKCLKTGSTGIHEIALCSLPEGIYFLQLQKGETTHTYKIALK